MSKKKKNKKKSYYDYAFGGKKSSKKSGKKSVYKSPEKKLKSIKPSLDKKDAKENKKILLAPIDIPAKFMKNRNKCNHVGDTLTVAEFKKMTPNYAAFTPMLDTMVELYGEENVAICKKCYDVVVAADCIHEGDVSKAVATLYAAANMTVSFDRMKDDEIKDIAKTKNALHDWAKIGEKVDEILEKETISVSNANGTVSDAEMSKLNKSGQVF